MARGLTRDQIGVTEEMIATFGDLVFRMSHNHQQRTGDPVRGLDWSEIERQQEDMGLTDQQIGDRLGLTRNQVLFIRTAMERRRFRTGHYSRLLELGGGKRFRAERFTPDLNHFKYSEAALALRASVRFDPERAREYVRRGWWRDDTISKWLARHAAERPDAPAIVHGATVLSWAQLADKVARLAGALHRAGVAKGDVVAVQLPNIPELLIAYFAICRLGAVLSSLHMPYRAAEIETLLAHNKATAAVVLAEAKDFRPAEAVLAMRARLPHLKAVIAHGPKVQGAFVLGEMIEQSPPLDPETVDPPVAADPFLLLYTSGTTAAPKGVPHNYHTILSNARLGAPEHKITAADRVLSAAPFTHLFGLYSVHVSLAVGAAIVLLPVFTPADLAATVARDKPTALWTAPAHFAALRAQDLVAKHDFSSLKMMIMSGSACPPDLVRWTAAEPSVVLTMAKLSVGSVLKPGDPFITLMPIDTKLEAEIRISARDVGFIRAGDPCVMKIDAFNAAEHGTAHGKVRWISEGTFTTDDDGKPVDAYYKARCSVDASAFKGVPSNFRLIPGMTLQGDINVGTRSVAMYLLGGMLKGMSEAMREP